jgi:hypothetical protein
MSVGDDGVEIVAFSEPIRLRGRSGSCRMAGALLGVGGTMIMRAARWPSMTLGGSGVCSNRGAALITGLDRLGGLLTTGPLGRCRGAAGGAKLITGLNRLPGLSGVGLVVLGLPLAESLWDGR